MWPANLDIKFWMGWHFRLWLMRQFHNLAALINSQFHGFVTMLKSCSPICFSSSGKALERSVRTSCAKLFACLSKSGKRSPTKKSAAASMSFCEHPCKMFVHSVWKAQLSGPPGSWGRLLFSSNIGKIKSLALASLMLWEIECALDWSNCTCFILNIKYLLIV